MARLRNHETFGNSVKCVTLNPYAKGEGPTFTVHLFETGVEQNGKKVCAFELWQRDLDKKRHLVLEGQGLDLEDPKQDASILALTELIAFSDADPSEDPKTLFFQQEHAALLHEASTQRFGRKAKPVAKPEPKREVEFKVKIGKEPESGVEFQVETVADDAVEAEAQAPVETPEEPKPADPASEVVSNNSSFLSL